MPYVQVSPTPRSFDFPVFPLQETAPPEDAVTPVQEAPASPPAVQKPEDFVPTKPQPEPAVESTLPLAPPSIPPPVQSAQIEEAGGTFTDVPQAREATPVDPPQSLPPLFTETATPQVASTLPAEAPLVPEIPVAQTPPPVEPTPPVEMPAATSEQRPVYSSQLPPFTPTVPPPAAPPAPVVGQATPPETPSVPPPVPEVTPFADQTPAEPKRPGPNVVSQDFTIKSKKRKWFNFRLR